LFIISIRLSIFKTIAVISARAFTVAVLSSSFNSAISQNIAQAFNSAILLPLIETETFQVLRIYHSQFDSAHSNKIISPSPKSLSSQLFII